MAEIKGLSMESSGDTVFYEIESLDGKTQRSVLYTADGNVNSIEAKMHVKDLPEAVKEAIRKEYSKGKMKKAQMITRNSEITYEVIVKSDKKKFELALDPNGKILKTEDVTNETEED